MPFVRFRMQEAGNVKTEERSSEQQGRQSEALKEKLEIAAASSSIFRGHHTPNFHGMQMKEGMASDSLRIENRAFSVSADYHMHAKISDATFFVYCRLLI